MVEGGGPGERERKMYSLAAGLPPNEGLGLKKDFRALPGRGAHFR